MLYSSPTSFLCPLVLVCILKTILLYFILLCSNRSDTMLRISFIHMVKFFLKSLALPSLIFLLSPYSTPFPWDLATHVGFWQKKNCSDSSRELFVCSEEHPEDPLGCTRSPLILGNLFLPDVFPTATFLQCPSLLCSIRINTQDPLLQHTIFLNGVWQGIDIWLSCWDVLALGTMMEEG